MKVWDVHNAIYDEGQRRIYIFGITDSPHLHQRAWHEHIYYLDIDYIPYQWSRFHQPLPYRTMGPFADYAAVYVLICAIYL